MKKTILILVANPQGSASLNLLPEVSKLQEAIQRSLNPKQFTIELRFAVRQEGFLRYILDIKPQIIHYAGHGTKEGLVIHDENDQVKLLSNKFLADLLKNFADCVECLVLNACDTEPLAIEVAKHINYAIGMNREVKDKSAIVFAEAFYDAIGAGEKIETAFEVGKNAVLGITSSDNKSRKLTHVREDDSPITMQNQEYKIPVLCVNPNPTEIKSLWLSPKETKKAVEQLLTLIEDSFNKIRLFHTSEPIILENQYIPVQVMLERSSQDKSERFDSYAESEAGMKKLYALKGGSEEIKPHQEDWQIAKKAESEAEMKKLYALKGDVEEIKRQQEDWQTAKQKESRIVVLADPGMGKSALLRMEVIEIVKISKQLLAEGKAVKEVTIPLFIRLSTLADEVPKGLTIKEAILTIIQRRYDSIFLKSDHNGTQEFLKIFLTEQLETEKCSLLLDALDEVPQEKRPQLLEKLNDFVNNYPNCRIIGTSRIVGYVGSLVNGAKEMEILPFTQLQVEQYIKTWFVNAAEYLTDNSVSAGGLIEELRQKPQINGLAQNPLLLSLICSLYQKKALVLPARRSQLYETAVDFMLNKWRRNRDETINPWKVRAKIKFLEKLGYDFSCEGNQVFSENDLYEKAEAFFKGEEIPSLLKNSDTEKLLLELMEEDGIIQKFHEEGKQCLFLHRTFQEYFTACYLNRASNPIELARQHFWDYDWHEIISLLAGLLDDPMPLLETIMQEKDDIFWTQLLLAGRCITECEGSNDPLIVQIVDKIYSLWCNLDVYDYRAIDGVWDDGRFPYLRKEYEYSNSLDFVTRFVIFILLGQNSSLMFEKIRNIIDNSEDFYRKSREALIILGIIGSPKAVDILRASLKNTDDNFRERIVKTLGKIGTLAAILALKDALQDSSGIVTMWTVDSLKKLVR